MWKVRPRAGEADCLSSNSKYHLLFDSMPQFSHLKNGITVVPATQIVKLYAEHLEQCLEQTKCPINISYLLNAWGLETAELGFEFRLQSQ